MGKRIFVTGISTGVGKTIAAAIITESLQADYWKPIQAGDLEYSDADKISDLISNEKSVIHPNCYALSQPMSPHAAAKIDHMRINISEIKEPSTENHLVIEGAGGLLVPLNDEQTILDLIEPSYKVIVVSRHYLGSINHSLLTIQKLKDLGCDVTILFSGPENIPTEEIVIKMTGAKVLGRIDEENYFDKKVVKRYAAAFRHVLESL